MSKLTSITRYNLLVKKLRIKPCTFAEIQDYLALESEIYGERLTVSERTFNRDRKEILSLYNIDIAFDFSRKVYLIRSDVAEEGNNRILEAFDVFNALNLSDRLSKYIHFEKRKPQGTENLYGLLHAIENRLHIKFKYQKFWEDKISERTVEPYALKEFKNRWYLLARYLSDSKLKTFALDRLTDFEPLKKKFSFPIDFDVENHFQYCFGIISPNEHQAPENVVLSFNPFQGKYIKSLPLHASQETLTDNEHELRIRLKLFLTQDFLMEIRSFGDNVKVLEPVSLVDDMKSGVKRLSKIYEL